MKNIIVILSFVLLFFLSRIASSAQTVCLNPEKRLEATDNLVAAVTAISTCEAVLEITKEVVITSGLTIPPNISLRLSERGYFTIRGGATLIIKNGAGFNAPQNKHIFRGSGNVTFDSLPERIYPEWWGAKAVDFTSMQQTVNVASINKAIVAASEKGAEIYFQAGKIYYLNEQLLFDRKSNVTLTSSPKSKAALLFTQSGASPLVSLGSSQYLTFEHLRFYYNNTAFTGDYFKTDRLGAAGDSDAAWIVFRDSTFDGQRDASNNMARNAASYLNLEKASTVQIERCAFFRARVAIYGHNGSTYSNAITLRDNSFSLQSVAAIKNAGQTWTIDSNTFEPLVDNMRLPTEYYGGLKAYAQDDYFAYNFNFINNWLGDAASGSTAVTVKSLGLRISGNFFELSSTSTAVEIRGSEGVSITANTFNSHNGVIFAGTSSSGISIVGNRFQGAGKPITTNNLATRYFFSGNTNADNLTDTATTFAGATTLYSANAVGLRVGGGTVINNILSNTATLDFGATAANNCEDLTVTITGAAIGDVVSLGIPNSLGTSGNTTLSGFVQRANVVVVRRCNSSNSTAPDPAAATVRVMITKF